jgi:hypothetical protein
MGTLVSGALDGAQFSAFVPRPRDWFSPLRHGQRLGEVIVGIVATSVRADRS